MSYYEGPQSFARQIYKDNNYIILADNCTQRPLENLGTAGSENKSERDCARAISPPINVHRELISRHCAAVKADHFSFDKFESDCKPNRELKLVTKRGMRFQRRCVPAAPLPKAATAHE